MSAAPACVPVKAMLLHLGSTGHGCAAVDDMMDDGPKMKGGGRGGRGGGGGGRGGAPGRGPLLLGPSRGEQNDYCQHFVDTGQRPQNFLRDIDMVCSCCQAQHVQVHLAPLS